MIHYVFSFFLLLIIAGLTVRLVFITLDKLPNQLGYNLWFIFSMIFTFVMLALIAKPNFFKIHTNGNGIDIADLAELA